MQGKVGFLYPSDYAYTYAYGVEDTCYSEAYSCDDGNPSAGWLFIEESQWFITPDYGELTEIYYGRTGGAIYHQAVSKTDGVRPTVYLKSNIKLTGIGTSSDPYKIVP